MMVMAAIMKSIAVSLIVYKIKQLQVPHLVPQLQLPQLQSMKLPQLQVQCPVIQLQVTQWIGSTASITAFHHELLPGSSPDI